MCRKSRERDIIVQHRTIPLGKRRPHVVGAVQMGELKASVPRLTRRLSAQPARTALLRFSIAICVCTAALNATITEGNAAESQPTTPLHDLMEAPTEPQREGIETIELAQASRLTRAQRRAIQNTLNEMGFEVGYPDGQFGPATRRGVRQFQRALGARPTGRLTQRQIEALIGATVRPTTQRSTRSASVPFKTMRDTDLPGFDYRTPQTDRSLKGIKLQDCADRCAQDDRCAAFTFNDKVSWCFLKSGHGRSVRFEGAISGIKQTQTASTQPRTIPTTSADGVQFQNFPETDLPGSDYASGLEDPSLEGIGPEGCQVRCANDPRCKSFTYNTDEHICFLKNTYPNHASFRGAYSGAKSDVAEQWLQEAIDEVDAPERDLLRLINTIIRDFEMPKAPMPSVPRTAGFVDRVDDLRKLDAIADTLPDAYAPPETAIVWQISNPKQSGLESRIFVDRDHLQRRTELRTKRTVDSSASLEEIENAKSSYRSWLAQEVESNLRDAAQDPRLAILSMEYSFERKFDIVESRHRAPQQWQLDVLEHLSGPLDATDQQRSAITELAVNASLHTSGFTCRENDDVDWANDAAAEISLKVAVREFVSHGQTENVLRLLQRAAYCKSDKNLRAEWLGDRVTIAQHVSNLVKLVEARTEYAIALSEIGAKEQAVSEFVRVYSQLLAERRKQDSGFGHLYSLPTVKNRDQLYQALDSVGLRSLVQLDFAINFIPYDPEIAKVRSLERGTVETTAFYLEKYGLIELAEAFYNFANINSSLPTQYFIDREQPKNALDFLENQYVRFSQERASKRKFELEYNLARTYQRSSDFSKARKYAQIALQTSVKLGAPDTAEQLDEIKQILLSATFSFANQRSNYDAVFAQIDSQIEKTCGARNFDIYTAPVILEEILNSVPEFSFCL